MLLIYIVTYLHTFIVLPYFYPWDCRFCNKTYICIINKICFVRDLVITFLVCLGLSRSTSKVVVLIFSLKYLIKRQLLFHFIISFNYWKGFSNTLPIGICNFDIFHKVAEEICSSNNLNFMTTYSLSLTKLGRIQNPFWMENNTIINSIFE